MDFSNLLHGLVEVATWVVKVVTWICQINSRPLLNKTKLKFQSLLKLLLGTKVVE